MSGEAPITQWADALQKVIGGAKVACVDRVRVMAETASTQDTCRAACAGKPGLLVVTDRQSCGRGRLGRAWAHAGGLGLAATFALDATLSPERLALAGGLAACEVVARSVDVAVGLRWPNDVVERTPGGAGRKIAGVLVERAGGVALLGVGINVRQVRDDFPPEVRGRAASIGMLGGGGNRLEVLAWLIVALDRVLGKGAAELATRWRGLDCLVGLTREFEHDGTRVCGRVRDIDPLGCIVLDTDGGVVSLPALTTSLVHEGD